MTPEQLQIILKHLPPSGATLRLLDLAGMLDDDLRPDLKIETVDGPSAADRYDAVVACDQWPDAALLADGLRSLRPGGRLILLESQGQAEQRLVDLLESAGYTRILIESLAAGGVLLRGEKPHTQQRTLDRIQQTAAQPEIRGPYVHLLIQQRPNKPVWTLRPGEAVEWRAVAVEQAGETHLLGFSSLPKAVAFMQPAVLAGLVRDVNKVGKFSRETASTWPLPLRLNPAVEDLSETTVLLWPVDPRTAQQPDEA